jgi:predicted O-methyltransferase YrrM
VRADRRAVADALFEASRVHDQAQGDRVARFRNLEPDTAELLGVLVRAVRARRVLELGTSNGHSTLWLADAVEATGGRVQSIELDPRRTALARTNLERAGLAALVELRTADAADALAEFPSDAWEFVFLDAERPHYLSYLPDLLRVIDPGGTLAVDNAISHAEELREFRELVSSEQRLTTVLVPIGAGLLLSTVSI